LPSKRFEGKWHIYLLSFTGSTRPVAVRHDAMAVGGVALSALTLTLFARRRIYIRIARERATRERSASVEDTG